MTTDLRALDRRCAELMGCDYAARLDPEPWSSDPHATNLLIEDLRERNVRFIMFFPNHGFTHVEVEGELVERHGATWMEAVARFYVAVRESET